jgi:hypothetical protein
MSTKFTCFVTVATSNTTSGNPRRLIVIKESDQNPLYMTTVAVIEQGYRTTRQAIQESGFDPVMAEFGTFHVSPSEYRDWVKHGAAVSKNKEGAGQ